jgi:16S rRNA (guanine966-N2)-methyltransferase
MRIIAGKWRGRTISAPIGGTTRPTTDRVREALFSMLASRIGSFEGLKVIDLFAGSGALGLEALSRGAAHCTFVERDPTAVAALHANIARLGADADIRAQAIETFHGGSYDLAFADAPYGTAAGEKALGHIELAPRGWAVLETGSDETPEVEGLAAEASRTYGNVRITLLRASA